MAAKPKPKRKDTIEQLVKCAVQSMIPKRDSSGMIDDFVHILSEEVYYSDEQNEELGRRLEQLSALGELTKITVPSISDMVVDDGKLLILTEDRVYTVKPTDKVAYKKRETEWDTDKLYRLGGTLIKAGIKDGTVYGPYIIVEQNFRVSIHKYKPIQVMVKNMEYLYVS
jgi:hypothetical protein